MCSARTASIHVARHSVELACCSLPFDIDPKKTHRATHGMSHVEKEVYRGRCWRSDDSPYPPSLRQVPSVCAQPRRTVSHHVTLGICCAGPTTGAHGTTKMGQRNIERLAEGCELDLRNWPIEQKGSVHLNVF